jgi:hypothetical protein
MRIFFPLIFGREIRFFFPGCPEISSSALNLSIKTKDFSVIQSIFTDLGFYDC